MCLVPDAPAPIQPRSAPRSPDSAMTDNAAAAQRRRATLASMVLTDQSGGMGAAPTAAKTVLGA